ncbi:chondroitin AC/alginate lyase [Leucosporidium creatinivorum]|uniref:Chondroitin AC/alginate lyase n=1 Tax=Leucosporidium creatinivorum TaxID=106004 RepID=A0A1Y2ESH6_9BASI|nr:chondroitin AC/alginate lyase [Leucosporidium creatinivorum]
MQRGSIDSAQAPLHGNSNQAYQGVPNNGYGSGWTGEKSTRAPSKKSKKWLWIILAIIAVCAIVGAVVGGVVGSRSSKNKAVSKSEAASAGGSSSSKGKSTSTKSSSGSNAAGGSTRSATGVNDGVILATATDANGNPLYPTTTGSAIIAKPTILSDKSVACQADPYSFTNTSSLAVRNEHPLLIAPSYKWDCLMTQIPNDVYLKSWNETIMSNATVYYNYAVTNYTEDGGLTGSGVLDPAREVQLRIKHWAYAYRMTNDTKWVERTWTELLTASGNGTAYFGPDGDNWNSVHFLDLAEFCAAFAIAYDWLYDAWTEERRTAIMWSIITLGLEYGNKVYTDPYGAAEDYSWWRLVNGNWNCVCNNGLAMGALAIANEDPTGLAASVLAAVTENANGNCVESVQTDGTWTETPNYWYFGTYSHAEMASSLLTATGSSQNLLTTNPATNLSALYHMYVTGQQGKFDYGDTGPNKYTATANALLFYGDQFDIPMYTLFQRDRGDVVEPMAMFWYNPETSGQFWDGLALDHHFDNPNDAWASMRSSWTDTQGTYVAMKAGNMTGHQTHGDVDGGDFVLDALGQRWAGELGNGNYLAEGYFTSEAQDAERWWYYRKATEGQNTILIDSQNQNVLAAPNTTFLTTGEAQDALVYKPDNSSTAVFSIDMTTYNNETEAGGAKRAIRFINGRRQVLIRDEITSTASLQWRMQTNATITMSNNNQTATLTLNDEILIASLRQPSNGAFFTQAAVAASTDHALASGSENENQPNPGVTVLTVACEAGTNTIEVLFNPQWPDFNANSYVDPPDVTIDNWTLTSHEISS